MNPIAKICHAGFLWRTILVAAIGAVGIAGPVTRARAAQLEVPLALDYLLLDAAVKQRFYTAAGGRAQFWSDPDNCGHLEAVNPRFSRLGNDVQLASEADFEAAIGLGGRCLKAMSWNGNLVATAKPWVSDFTLKFRITDLNFVGVNGAAIGGAAFGLVKNGLIDQLGSFSYDLRPYLRQLQGLAEGLPSTPAANEVKTALASLRLAPQIVAQDDGVEGKVEMDVPDALLSPCIAPLTAAEQGSWHAAADHISNLIATMANQTQALMPDAQLGQEVTAIAADSRARVAAAANAPPAGGDPLPLFRHDWQRLRSAVKSAARRGSLRDQTGPVLGAVAAVDAVFAIDQRPPGLGCQLAQAGLGQLAGPTER